MGVFVLPDDLPRLMTVPAAAGRCLPKPDADPARFKVRP